MFYVSSYKNDLIGVSDTDDGVEEFYTLKDLSNKFPYELLREVIGLGHKVVSMDGVADFISIYKITPLSKNQVLSIKNSPCYTEFIEVLGDNAIYNLIPYEGGIAYFSSLNFRTRYNLWATFTIKYHDGNYSIDLITLHDFKKFGDKREYNHCKRRLKELGFLSNEIIFLINETCYFRVLEHIVESHSFGSLKELIDYIKIKINR